MLITQTLKIHFYSADKVINLTLSNVVPGPLVILEEGVLFYLLYAIPPETHLSVHSRRMTSDISAVYT